MRKIMTLGLGAISAIAFAAASEAGAAAPAPEKVVLKQNGIKRPDSGSITGKLWDIADEISNNAGRPAQRKEVVDRYMVEQPGANPATANTQYARWVQYYGVADTLREQRLAETEARRAAKKAERTEADAAKIAEKEQAAAEKAAAKQERERVKLEKAEAAKVAKEERDRVRAEKAAQAEADKKAKAEAREKAKAEKEAAAKEKISRSEATGGKVA